MPQISNARCPAGHMVPSRRVSHCHLQSECACAHALIENSPGDEQFDAVLDWTEETLVQLGTTLTGTRWRKRK